MKNELLTTAMKNSISDVLETMFFLSLDYSDNVAIHELWSTGKGQILASKLNFEGPFSGNTVFYIPKKIALSITADFLGKDENDVFDDQINGTVKELINMLTGNTFSIYDPDAVFDLEVPEMVKFDDSLKDLSDSEKTISIVIETMENHLAFQMNFRIDD